MGFRFHTGFHTKTIRLCGMMGNDGKSTNHTNADTEVFLQRSSKSNDGPEI